MNDEKNKEKTSSRKFYSITDDILSEKDFEKNYREMIKNGEISVRNQEIKSDGISVYETVKKFLDNRANETARNGAIEFSKLFKQMDI
jgi:hypothetical protein